MAKCKVHRRKDILEPWTQLTRSETRIILEALQSRRNEWREEIIETFGTLPDRETSPNYYKLVDLQMKLTRHLENLPY